MRAFQYKLCFLLGCLILLASFFAQVSLASPLKLESVSPEQTYPGHFIDLYGRDLSTSVQVSIGGLPSSHVWFVDSSLLRVVVPDELQPGIYDIQVTHPNGQSAELKNKLQILSKDPAAVHNEAPLNNPRQFHSKAFQTSSILDQAFLEDLQQLNRVRRFRLRGTNPPTIDIVEPREINTNTATQIKIHGRNLHPDTQLFIGSTPCDQLRFEPTEAGFAYLQCELPPISSPGALNVIVMNQDGMMDVRQHEFLIKPSNIGNLEMYRFLMTHSGGSKGAESAPPIIHSVTPHGVEVNTTPTITILGANFRPPLRVLIGESLCTSIKQPEPYLIECKVPKLSPTNSVKVTVFNSDEANTTYEPLVYYIKKDNEQQVALLNSRTQKDEKNHRDFKEYFTAHRKVLEESGKRSLRPKPPTPIESVQRIFKTVVQKLIPKSETEKRAKEESRFGFQSKVKIANPNPDSAPDHRPLPLNHNIENTNLCLSPPVASGLKKLPALVNNTNVWDKYLYRNQVEEVQKNENILDHDEEDGRIDSAELQETPQQQSHLSMVRVAEEKKKDVHLKHLSTTNSTQIESSINNNNNYTHFENSDQPPAYSTFILNRVHGSALPPNRIYPIVRKPILSESENARLEAQVKQRNLLRNQAKSRISYVNWVKTENDLNPLEMKKLLETLNRLEEKYFWAADQINSDHPTFKGIIKLIESSKARSPAAEAALKYLERLEINETNEQVTGLSLNQVLSLAFTASMDPAIFPSSLDRDARLDGLIHALASLENNQQAYQPFSEKQKYFRLLQTINKIHPDVDLTSDAPGLKDSNTSKIIEKLVRRKLRK